MTTTPTKQLDVATIHRAQQIAKIESAEQATEVAETIEALKIEIERRDSYYVDAQAHAHAAWQGIIALRKRATASLSELYEKLRGLNGEWAKSERDREQREAAERRKREEAAALELAQRHVDAGDDAGAERVLTTQVQRAPEPVARTVKTSAAVSATPKWCAEIVDLPSLLRWIADDATRHHMVEIKMTGLNDIARAKKAVELGVPGVQGKEVFETRTRV